jgi:hypothetical protein
LEYISHVSNLGTLSSRMDFFLRFGTDFANLIIKFISLLMDCIYMIVSERFVVDVVILSVCFEQYFIVISV